MVPLWKHAMPARQGFWRGPVRTDRSGAFRIEGLGQDRFSGTIEADGHASLRVEAGAFPRDRVFTLEPTSYLDVRAVASEPPTPVIATITARPADDDDVTPGVAIPERLGKEREVVGPDRWRVRRLIPRSPRPFPWQVQVSDTLGRTGVGIVKDGGTEEPDRIVEVRLAPLTPPGSVEGRVVAPDGSPVEGVSVRLLGRGVATRTVTTRADGEFRFSSLHEAFPTLCVVLRVEARDWIAPPARLCYPDDLRIRTELRACPPSRITGRVTDARGNPLGRPVRVDAFEVLVAPNGRPYCDPDLAASAMTAPDGSFSMPRVWSARFALIPRHQLSRADGASREFGDLGAKSFLRRLGSEMQWLVRPAAGGDAYCDIVLSDELRAANVFGSVRVNGVPRAGATIRLAGVESWMPMRDIEGVFRSAQTDSQGRFAFELDRAGGYVLTLADGATTAHRAIQLKVTEDQTVDFWILIGAIAGRVIDGSGSGVAATVSVQREADRFRFGDDEGPELPMPEVVADASGRFELPQIEAGRYRLVAFDRAH